MSNWLDMYNAEEDASMYKQGGLIKRADGSYSPRGLWDNIRANRGSGRKPTAEMLRQERKINKHADGDIVGGENPPATFGNPYANYMRDWTNSPMGQSMLQKSVSLDNPSGNKLGARRAGYLDSNFGERSLSNIRGEKIIPNYSKTSFTKPYWEQMRDARVSAINNVDFQTLSNQDFNTYLNGGNDDFLGKDEVSNISGQSKFFLARKDFDNFIDNPIVDKFRETTRPENVDNTNYFNYVSNPYRALDKYTPSSKFSPMIRLRDNVADDNLADTAVHEISHTSDWNGILMPQSDVNLIESYGKDAKDTPFNTYVKSPTETRARLNSLRFQMKNQGIYNPFTEKATIDMFGSYKPLTDSSYDALEQLRGVYSDEEILDMINTISRQEPAKNPMLDNIQSAKDGGWIDMYADGDTVTNPPSELEALLAQYQAIQDQVNKGNTSKNAYVETMRKTADDLIAKGFDVNTVFPEYARNGNNCIGTACNLADQAGDKFYPEGSSFFIDNALAAKYAKNNPKASRYLEQDERFIEPGDIIQFKRGLNEKAGPYHAFTVYSIGEPNADGDRVVTVVGTHGSGPIVKEDAYILGKDNKLYSNLYGSRDRTPHATQLLKRREGSDNSYNELVTQRDAIKQQILAIDPQYFTPKEDIRSGDYKQTAFELNDQGQGNEYGKYVQTKDSGTDRQ